MSVAEQATAGVLDEDAVRRVEPDGFYTPDEFQMLAGNEDYELIDGRPVERERWAANSQYVAGMIYRRLGEYEERHGGFAFCDGTPFRAFGETGHNVYKPDAAYVAAGRLEEVPAGDILFAPDLVVEVASPSDTAFDLEDKTVDYLRGGTRVVWVVFPNRRAIRAVDASGETLFRADDTLTCDAVLPGFETPVDRLFSRTESAK